jgi:hypothetical protein
VRIRPKADPAIGAVAHGIDRQGKERGGQISLGGRPAASTAGIRRTVQREAHDTETCDCARGSLDELSAGQCFFHDRPFPHTDICLMSFAIIHDSFAVYRFCNLIVNDFFNCNSKKQNPPFRQEPHFANAFFQT